MSQTHSFHSLRGDPLISPPLSLLFVPAVKFEDCQRSREVGFVSSDPNFSVRPDGSVYAEQELANLSEPVQFMVTARGFHDAHIWETTVKLALAGHPHPIALTKVTGGGGGEGGGGTFRNSTRGVYH